MTQDEKSIKIAEACGWVKGLNRYQEEVYRLGDRCRYKDRLPDYFNDLNAMHEAEKVLTEQQFQTYLDWLDVSCGGELELSAMIDGPAFGFSLVHATASQRAEAFGKTLNLW